MKKSFQWKRFLKTFLVLLAVVFHCSANAQMHVPSCLEQYENESAVFLWDPSNAEAVSCLERAFEVPASQRTKASRELLKKLEKVAWSPRNLKLKEWVFQEPTNRFPLKASVFEFVKQRRYLVGFEWWIGGAIVGQFTSDNSRSLLAPLHGENAIRDVFWPNDGYGNPDLSGFRMAVNSEPKKDSHGFEEKSMEIFFKNPESQKAEPFVLLKMGEKWIPANRVFGQEPKQVCSGCHQNSEGKLTSFPWVLYAEEADLQESGYYPEFHQSLFDDHSKW